MKREVVVQKQVGWTRLAIVFVALAALAAVVAPSALGGNQRLVVELEQTFVANGRVYNGGELSVREVGAYSPGVTINDVRINGERIGLLLAGEFAGQPVGTGNSVLFDRDSRGQLTLVGFAFRGQRPRKLYRFGLASGDGQTAARGAPPAGGQEPLVAAQ
jgi:hypothetical protein